jgi:dTDP-4-amino-4,6-dideoxygalactose transaminase
LKIPFLDLGAEQRAMGAEISAAIQRVVSSGWYIGGPEVEAFETAFASFVEAPHCVGVGNGLDALHLALRALDIGEDDEVIVASNGFIATLLAVSMAGATPVLVEPDPDSFNLDPARVEAAITSRTRAILPTHLYGRPANLDVLSDIARRHGLLLIEDAAQAHGARYRGQRIGAHGDIVTWSFYPSKNLGALGDGGAVTTNDRALAQRIRALGNYGSRTRYVNDERGVNSRLDPLQAAVLAAKLPHLDASNDRRRQIAARYLDELSSTGLTLPSVADDSEPVWHLFVIRSERRDALAEHLAAHGVQTLIHYPIPPHLQGAYADLGFKVGDFPIAERMAQSVLSLPIGPQMADDAVDAVIAAVKSFC